jgi:N-acetylglutamate synthase-like GNAT family acetyltransferase
MSIEIRSATRRDADGIARLVGRFAARGEVLPRSQAEIEATLADWIVATEQGQVIGCGSLLRYTDHLSEVRSLVVDGRHQARGLGTAIVEGLIGRARTLEIGTLFTLTRATGLFERIGFLETKRDFFPEKVWRDCALCPIQENCDEVAMVLSLNGSSGTSPSKPR